MECCHAGGSWWTLSSVTTSHVAPCPPSQTPAKQKGKAKAAASGAASVRLGAGLAWPAAMLLLLAAAPAQFWPSTRPALGWPCGLTARPWLPRGPRARFPPNMRTRPPP